MTSKDYCSKVCGAKCCRAHGELISPSKCPKLTAENLCSVYKHRLEVRFDGLKRNGELVKIACVKPEAFMPNLPPEVLAQCCVAHPELLKNR